MHRLAANGVAAVAERAVRIPSPVLALPGQDGLLDPALRRLAHQVKPVQLDAGSARARLDSNLVASGRKIAEGQRRGHREIRPAARSDGIGLHRVNAIHDDRNGVAQHIDPVTTVEIGITKMEHRRQLRLIQRDVVHGLAAVGGHADRLPAGRVVARVDHIAGAAVRRLRLADQEADVGVHDLHAEFGTVRVVVAGHFLEERPPRAVEAAPVLHDRKGAVAVLDPVDVGLAVGHPHGAEAGQRGVGRRVCHAAHVDHLGAPVGAKLHVGLTSRLVVDVQEEVGRVHGYAVDADARPRRVRARAENDGRPVGHGTEVRRRQGNDPGIPVLVQDEDLVPVRRIRHAPLDPQVLGVGIGVPADRRDRHRPRMPPPEVDPHGFNLGVAVAVKDGRIRAVVAQTVPLAQLEVVVVGP